MTDSFNIVTSYLPSSQYLPRLSVFLLLLWLRERAVISLLTFHNILHMLWLDGARPLMRGTALNL
jgi:hypothetical protein